MIIHSHKRDRLHHIVAEAKSQARFEEAKKKTHFANVLKDGWDLLAGRHTSRKEFRFCSPRTELSVGQHG